MSYKNILWGMITIVTSISCFMSISGYAAPTIQKIGMSPANTEILAGSEAVALTVKASGSKLTYEWMLQGQGTLQEPTTKPAVFYIPPQKLDVESIQVMISIIVKDEQGEEATENLLLRIVGNSNRIPPTPNPDQEGRLVFYEDFESGLNGWEKEEIERKGSTLKIVDCGQYGKCLKISRTSRGYTSIYNSSFRKYQGTLRFEAMIRAENVAIGEQYYERGKFIGYIEVGKDTVGYPDNDFEGTFDWTPHHFEASHLDGTQVVKLRIGLQSTTGTIYVDDIKVYHFPGIP